MDQQFTTPSRLPRPISRIPLPTSTISSASLKPSPSRERLSTDSGLKINRLRRPSSEFKKPLPRTLQPRNARNGYQQKRVASLASDGVGSENEKLLDARDNSFEDTISQETEHRGRVRPSLSERTIETLSQIPPSPASSRRPSTIYNATSPIRSPSRPPSSMTSYSRSPSRSSTSRQLSGIDFLSGPPSSVRLPSRPRPPLFANNPASDHTPMISADAATKLAKPMAKRSVYAGSGLTSESRGALSRAPADGTMAPPALQVKKTRKVQPKTSTSRLNSAAKAAAVPEIAESTSPDTKKATKSSSALRESIAKAKAARKAAAQKGPQASPLDAWTEAEIDDPFNQRPRDSNKGLLRKRLDAGRATGVLNIAAMSLATLPDEVLSMYDFDPNGSTDWYESVDLVKFIAADNEFTELPEAAFPDISGEVDMDSDDKGNQFGGLETLDLHGNLLERLPIGFRRLERLHTLNLSNNKLTMDDIDVVLEIKSLRDLKLAKNQLAGSGSFLEGIDRLANLEVLDLHDNSITTLPGTIANLKSLRVLDVGQNQLASLPFEALCTLPLREIIASKNRLQGALFPASVDRMDSLQTLDVVGNELSSLAESLMLPALQTLAISMNRIRTLPNVTTWQALLTLSAEDNSISELPSGFTEIKSLKNVDLTGNDITRLDERIGLMDNLSTFRIANNPLRERKFLSMAVEDMKRDLRNRCEPEVLETDDEEGSVATQFTLAPETPAQTSGWQLKPGGVLDRSYTDLSDFEVDKLETINPSDVRYLYLQHNSLRSFPVPALSLLAVNLSDLDLSHNPLDFSLFTSPLTLASLQTLNLCATGLTSLEPVMANLQAPSLTFLDVSSNGLTGSLPRIREAYSKMATFLAAENQLDSLEFEAVQGLQVLDVSNNNINSLPPKLGLLRADGKRANWGGDSALPLRRFEVAGNSFRVPRWQIVAKGTDAILEWLKDRMPAEELHEYESGDEED